MFTGIVQLRSTVEGVTDHAGGRRLMLSPNWPDVRHGESVAVNGVCLTVAAIDGPRLSFDVIAETLAKSNLGDLSAGSAVNLERSLRVGDRIDGHFVQGHVDGVATVQRVQADPNDWRLVLRSPPDLIKYLVPKGSICLDGTSLTLAALDGPHFTVALIPTTLSLTTLGSAVVGQRINMEADIFTKTIVATLERMRGMQNDECRMQNQSE